MSKVVLWGRASSANVQKAVWALEETGTTFIRTDVAGRFGGTDTPEFIAMNPNRLVPVLTHGDLTMWESHAIVRYVAAQFGTDTLWPNEPAERAIIDQWTDWTATTFQPAWLRLFWTLVRTPEAQRDAAAIDAALEASVRAMRIMDAQLQKTAYLAGDDFSYADIVAGASLYRWFTMEIERPSMSGVEAWHERLKQRPGFIKGVCVSYDELVGRLAF
ncbi:glutathione S-transferase family protein [Pelagibacterium lentulum]|uniref:Glutathione S-transferase n=1 Tax=Pelagibacterium lentulum TaxID=2029865 RepID=A0A916RGQ3_9HYPH|nr:glutathione S-transferase family protein [Pelagibacterium lentulum]GGA53218.1 glutathione S-transferase [Pelagibacterium lentulum]